LLAKRVANCSPRTLEVYETNLKRFEESGDFQALSDATLLAVQRHLTNLRDRMKPVSVHQHFRTLKTFLRWCHEAELVPADPAKGLSMRVPKTLPRVPDDEAVGKLLGACLDTYEGRRNKALVAILADSGLRISEALRLRIEDVSFAARTINVRGGKGQKDGVSFFGAETAQHVRSWLSKRRDARPEDYLFCDVRGRTLTRNHRAHILHRLSVRAGLPRKIGPHALRHYAASAILRQTGDLELVHESLAMALRYAHLTKPDVNARPDRL
jgi:site-specific recombinase XerD